ncbi:MAG: NFACT family protein [Lachnospiraceae bacterium]|nr:NFACT family protein [Lachnospiraceae bacterium]
MALDGITVCAAAHELRHFLTNGYISKITEPEHDELMVTVKTQEYGIKRMLISIGASMPFICLTESNKIAPVTAPAFTMLLRKHLQGGRIIEVEQPSLERILRIVVEHRDEMGDLVKRNLITELMGKYSNIMLTDADDKIIDALKRVPPSMSSVRTVLPGEQYFIPGTQDKADPFTQTDRNFFRNHVLGRPMTVVKALYGTYTGFSPAMASELCHRAGIDGDENSASLSEEDIEKLYEGFTILMKDLKEGSFAPEIVYDRVKNTGSPKEFAAVHLSMYEGMESVRYDYISGAIEDFYSKKNEYNHMRQRSADLRKIVSNAIERTAKKYDLQMSQLKDTEKMDKYKVYAELINTYGYEVEDGAKYFDAVNFYDGKEIRVPLDPSISVHENANKYFARYDKLKRTRAAAAEQAEESKTQLTHLKSIEASFETAYTEDDLLLISEELRRTGYIKKSAARNKNEKSRSKSKPLHYISSDGFDIYIGKNNIQNDELTFKMGKGNDWWFHSKTFPGSHVLLMTGKGDPMSVPDSTFNEAGRLAAYYSTGKDQDKVDIDYTLLKNVKKPAKAVPGYVIYHTNYSMTISADITGIKKADKE